MFILYRTQSVLQSININKSKTGQMLEIIQYTYQTPHIHRILGVKNIQISD